MLGIATVVLLSPLVYVGAWILMPNDGAGVIVAVVMVLQRLFGLSDREAVEAFEFDARWKYACGGLDFDYPGFVHTVLVDMRARLDRSERPRRIFEVSLDAARRAGVVSAKRVLDSTPLYDAVATQDTVTMIRSAIRQLLAAADEALESELRAVLRRDDDYGSGGKPSCDWDDPAAREKLVAELAADGFACLGVLDGRDLTGVVAQTAELLATVLGQDLEEDERGRFRIARKVARDRVISTVDTDARHGHKTQARGFDGYKGHVAVDPDMRWKARHSAQALRAGLGHTRRPVRPIASTSSSATTRTPPASARTTCSARPSGARVRQDRARSRRASPPGCRRRGRRLGAVPAGHGERVGAARDGRTRQRFEVGPGVSGTASMPVRASSATCSRSALPPPDRGLKRAPRAGAANAHEPGAELGAERSQQA